MVSVKSGYLGILSTVFSSLWAGGSSLLVTPSNPAAIVTAIIKYGFPVPLGTLFSM